MSSKNSPLFLTLMVGLTIAACLICAEIAFSLAGYSGEIMHNGRFLTTYQNWNNNSWWRSAHNREPMPTVYRIRELTSESTGSIEIHEHSFPVRKTPGKKRILFIGDSGTYGSGVREADTFINQVRQTLPKDKYDVINAGVPGFSPTQSFDQFFKNLVHLKPDVVIYTMFLANDVLDLLEDPYIDRWNRFIPEIPLGLPLEHSAAVNFIRLSIAKYRHSKSPESEPIIHLNRTDENGIRLDHNSCTGRYRSYLTPLHPQVNSLWLQFSDLLKTNQSKFQAMNIPFVVFILPTHSTLKGEFVYLNTDDDIPCLERAGLKYEPDKVDSQLPLKNMLGLCDKLGLKCINSVPTVKKTLGLDFYIPNDDHPNEEGHRVLGEILLNNRNLWDPEASE